MPIKFSSLETKPVAQTSKINGLYEVNGTTQNCNISTRDFAFSAETYRKDETYNQQEVDGKINQGLQALNGKANIDLDNLSDEGKKVIQRNSPAGMPIGVPFPAPYNNWTPSGAVRCDGAEYSSSQYPTFWNNYIKKSRIMTCSYESFDADVAKSGGCIRFAVRGDRFKVPLIGEGTFLAGGNFGSYEAGLPNITGELGWQAANHGITSGGAFSTETMYRGDAWRSLNHGGNKYKWVLDASRSNQAYGKSDTVQPKHLRVPYFVQLVEYVDNVGPGPGPSPQPIQGTSVVISGFPLGIPFPAPYKDWAPEGVVPADGHEYASTTYPELWNDYIKPGKVMTCTYAQFEEDVAKSGGCSKFAVNGYNFRVPKIGSGVFIESGNGEVHAAGLPNITGRSGYTTNRPGLEEGCFTTEGTGWLTWDTNSGYTAQKFDASKSNPIYGKSNTVQPKSITMKYFIQVKTITPEMGAGTNIGSIFTAPYKNFTPTGAVLCDGTEFSSSQFQSFFNDFIKTNAVETVSYPEFQQEITTKGFCRKFAVNGNHFKVPYMTFDVIGKTSGVKGNGKTLGLTDGQKFAGLGTSVSPNNVFTGADAYNVNNGQSISDRNPLNTFKAIGVTTNTSKSGMIAELPQEPVKYYVQLANGSSNPSMMDWSRYMQGLEGKANKDLSNVSANLDVPYAPVIRSDGSGYRYWKSGWLEQWGTHKQVDSGVFSTTFPKPFANTSYFITDGWTYRENSGIDHQECTGHFKTKNTTGFSRYYWRLLDDYRWYACGQGA